MGIRSRLAIISSAITTWAVRHLAHRPGGSLPGKVALTIDPKIVSKLHGKFRDGCIVVVGTNGKTTTTNLLADAITASGKTVLCNRGGDNLKNGIATALLQGKKSDWGVIECDELWLEKVLPEIKADWVLLLNLFRDQLDRCGEIEIIQNSIINALISTPNAGLIYNADDPLCAYIAKCVIEYRNRNESKSLDIHEINIGENSESGYIQTDVFNCGGNASMCSVETEINDGKDQAKQLSDFSDVISFGLLESMDLAQNKVTDATLCQVCSHLFDYEFRQYGQLGYYKCPNCGFQRPKLKFVAKNIKLDISSLAFDACNEVNDSCNHITAEFSGTYNVYNLLAIYACSQTIGCGFEAFQNAIDNFNPKNGRLQWYEVQAHRVLLNLAKNPTGFNQNLRIISEDQNPLAVAFFINDKVVDGHDISWIWDIDFEEIVAVNKRAFVFAGGSRKNDLQVRLKYAGVKAVLVNSIEEVLSNLGRLVESGELPADATLYVIANYSALPPVRESLNQIGEVR